MGGEVMPGGIVAQDVSDGYDAAHLIHKKAHADKYLSSVCDYQVDSLLSYSTQVVSGFMKRVEFKVQGKGCKDLTCSGKVWSQSWLGADKVTKYECKSTNSKRKSGVWGIAVGE